MASKTRISARISPYTFQRLSREMDKEIERVTKFSEELGKALADFVADQAQRGYEYALYDGVNDVVVSVRKTKKGNYSVVATGEAVAFIEFGAGVYFSDDPYPGEIPSRYGGIGSYGLGHGNDDEWRFPYRPGVKTTAEGTVYETTRIIGGRDKAAQIPVETRLDQPVSRDPKSPYYYKKVGLGPSSVGRRNQLVEVVASDDENSPFYYKKWHTRARNVGKRLMKTYGTGKHWVYTHGNPANACLWTAYDFALDEFNEIVEEVQGG